MGDETIIRSLSDATLRELKRMRDEITSLRHDVNNARTRRGSSFPIFIRTGEAYDNISPASETAPNRGYVTLDNIDVTNQVFAEADENNRVYAYNLGPTLISSGDRVILGLHVPSFHDTDPRAREAIWVAIPAAVSSTPLSGYAQLSTTDPLSTSLPPLSIASLTTTPRSIPFESWEHAESGSTNELFELVEDNGLDIADDRKIGIKVLQTGMYTGGFNASLETLTSGGTATAMPVVAAEVAHCTYISIKRLSLYLTVNDNAVTAKADPERDVTGDGSVPGHAPVMVTTWQICNKYIVGNGNHVSPITLQADDIVRLWYDPEEIGSCTLNVDMWLQYLGPAPGYEDP